MLDDILIGNYKLVATRLGLTIDGGVTDGNVRVHGVIDDVPLQMWFGVHATHVAAELATPAPLELSIVTTTLIGKLEHLFGDHTMLGDAEFDKHFSVKSPDVPRLATLLDDATRKMLLEIAHEGLHPAVDQRHVHLRRWSAGGMDGEAKIERDFHAAARLAKVVSASFARAA
jgi:hypothetical protein